MHLVKDMSAIAPLPKCVKVCLPCLSAGFVQSTGICKRFAISQCLRWKDALGEPNAWVTRLDSAKESRNSSEFAMILHQSSAFMMHLVPFARQLGSAASVMPGCRSAGFDSATCGQESRKSRAAGRRFTRRTFPQLPGLWRGQLCQPPGSLCALDSQRSWHDFSGSAAPVFLV